MATYTKKLLTLTVTTVRGATYTITDTDECPYASQALYLIKQGQPFYVSTADGEFLINASAVESAKMEYSESEPIEIPDICPSEKPSGPPTVKLCSQGQTDAIFCSDSDIKTATALWDAAQEYGNEVTVLSYIFNPDEPVQYSNYRESATSYRWEYGSYYLTVYMNEGQLICIHGFSPD